MTPCLSQVRKPFELAELLDEQCLSPAEVRNPVLQDLAKRWHHAKEQGAFPNRSDFRPETLLRALGRLMILQVEGVDEPSFRYRLIGTEICDFFGYDLTGQTTDAIPCPAFGRSVWAQNRETCRTRQPAFHGLRITDGAAVHQYEKVILPVATETGASQLIVCSFPLA